MKMILPALAVVCFALSGVGCASSSCCGKCGGGHGDHSHADGSTHSHDGDKKCCGKCGKDKPAE